jgi:hypothetical protein
MAEPAERLCRSMAVIRGFETSAERMLRRGTLAGNLHLSTGQEAVAAGVCDVLRRDDHITTAHRGHGHCLARGADPERMYAELLGRSTGYCGGKAGSMHVADPATGNLGATAIVGGGIAIAAGAALSAQVRGTDQVAVAFFGEGAVAEGAFHEALNLAALWRLPLVLAGEHRRRRAANCARRCPASPSRTGCPACSSTATTRPRCARPPRPPCHARAGEGPRCSSARRTAGAGTTWATRSATARRRSSPGGGPVTRSPGSRR